MITEAKKDGHNGDCEGEKDKKNAAASRFYRGFASFWRISTRIEGGVLFERSSLVDHNIYIIPKNGLKVKGWIWYNRLKWNLF